MTFALYHQGDGQSLKDSPKEIMKSLQICILKDLFGSRGESHGGGVETGAQGFWDREQLASSLQ